MRTQGHIAGGILVTGAAIALGNPSPELSDRLMVWGAVTASLPDLDVLVYFLKKKKITYENDFFHHTWISHTFPFYLIPGFLAYYLFSIYHLPDLQWFAAIFMLTTSFHLIQDMFGSGDGIMLFYPFSRKMVGFELTGTHGPEWLSDYKNTRSFRIEVLSIYLAGATIAGYIGVRTGFLSSLFSGSILFSDVLLGVANILRVIYFIFTCFYISFIVTLLANLIHQVYLRYFRKQMLAPRPRTTFSELFDSSLALNATLAIFSTLIVVLITAALEQSVPIKFIILAFSLSILSYGWGTKATGLGVINGTTGTAFSLFVFTLIHPEVTWWGNAHVLLGINVLSNIAGWLGGFVSCGQIRESQCVSYFEIHIKKSTRGLIEMSDMIANVIPEVYFSRYGKCTIANVHEGEFKISDSGNKEKRQGIIENAQLERRFLFSHYPFLDAIGWVFDRNQKRRYPTEIVDQTFNLSRNIITHFIARTFTTTDKKPVYKVELAFFTYRETPSIVWVDKEIIGFANTLHDKIEEKIAEFQSGQLEIKQRGFSVLKSFEGNLKIEQHQKDTWLVRSLREGTTLDISFDTSRRMPEFVWQEFSGSKTFFDQWRGRPTTIIIFIASQVLLGLALNMLNNVLLAIN